MECLNELNNLGVLPGPVALRALEVASYRRSRGLMTKLILLLEKY